MLLSDWDAWHDVQMKEALAIVYHEHGKPLDVLKLENRPVSEPGPGEVLLALRRAVIHPSDMGMIGGSYGRLKTLPAVAGREGVGEVVAVGEGVRPSSIGRRARMPEESGVWVEAVTAPISDMLFLPEGMADDLTAQAFINPPTALRLLKDFVNLEKGDWIIQNAGNSAVGFCVAGLARSMGVNTLCVVRNVEQWEDPLKEAGATAVVAEDSGYEKSIQDITGGQLPSLGLNSVGGDSVMRIVKSMADGGTIVTFGGMVGDKVRFPTRELIFKDVCLRGFWMDRWLRNATKESALEQFGLVCLMLNQGVMQVPVDTVYNVSDGLAAVEHALQSRRGKVLIGSDWNLT